MLFFFGPSKDYAPYFETEKTQAALSPMEFKPGQRDRLLSKLDSSARDSSVSLNPESDSDVVRSEQSSSHHWAQKSQCF